MNLPSAFVVADLGKTNKKLLLYSMDLICLAESKKKFEPTLKDGLEWENVKDFEAWMLGQIGEWSLKYKIEVISISAHGATMGMLDSFGQEVLPVLSYTSTVDPALLQEFTDTFGSPREVHRSTWSPDLGIINLCRQIFALQKLYPDAIGKAKTWMSYNGYLAWRLCGQAATEISYLGNHSGLWNHEQGSWSEIAKQLHIDKQAAPFQPAWKKMGTVKKELLEQFGISGNPAVVTGLHDSNAALLPYLIAEGSDKPIILSTGTWCLAMGMQASLTLSEEDLDMGSYHNINIFGDAVKTVGFTGGYEYGWWEELLGTLHHLSSEDFEACLEAKSAFIYPGLMGGTVFPKMKSGLSLKGEFVESNNLNERASELQSIKKELACALNLSLAIQATIALAGVGSDDLPVVVEGGFINNVHFLSLLAQMNPKRKIQTSALKEASAYGAGLAALAAHQNVDPRDLGASVKLPLAAVQPSVFKNLASYIQQYHSTRSTLENIL